MLNRLSLNRIGLNRIGLNRIGKPSGGSSDRPYIDPKVLDSLCGVWIMDQNTNESESRNIIKNKIADRGGDLELLNFGYKLNSGYGKYELDFNEFTTNTNINTVLIEKNKDTFYAETLVNNSTFLIYKTIQANNTLTDTPSFKAKVEINKGTTLQYRYINSDGVQSFFNITEEGEHEFPISYNNRYVNSAGVATNGFVLDGKNTCRITQIPDYEDALVSDGKDDYGKAEGLPIFKDYTVVSKYSRFESTPSYLLSKAAQGNDGAFIFNDMSSSYSFATSSPIDTHTLFSTVLRYQSKYINQGKSINAGSGIDTDSLWLSIIRDNDNRLFAGAFYSMLLFPYSLSEFLLERQLKKYKLGTLYPDMVEFRPVVKSNVGYDKIVFHYQNKNIQNGTYFAIGSEIVIYVRLSSKPSNEIKTLMVNGTPAIFVSHDTNINVYQYKFYLPDKSPQKVNITIDEYIRFEDIVQPYPIIVNLSQDGKILTWGDKLKVGSEVVVTNYTILLPELYTHGGGIRYNGTTINLNAPIVVAKSMVFTNVHTWKLNTTEPHAIYSPQKLNIPNSSLKILGYIPDLTGKGNHGKLNNFAYTEDSGVAADGSIKFDGTDDHITIPTLAHGGKCVMMKVNWSNVGMLYDQRPDGGYNTFSIYTGENHPAYNARNNGSTYIDGILNTSIIPSDLVGITHNITAVNDAAIDNNTVSPRLGVSVSNATFSNMSLYEFMLFPEIPSEDEIKKLNDVMGIEGGYVESPNYYWDAYGKKNTDTDRNLIADQVSKDVANALEVKNVAYNSESGYGYGKSNFISIMESSQQFVDIIDDYNFIIKATPHNNNQFFAQVNTPKLIPNNYIRFKVSGMPEDFKMVFGYDYVEGGTNAYSHIIDKNGVYSYDSFNIFYTSFRAYTGYTDLTGLNIKVEFLDYHPNGLLLDGVEDYLINTVIPAVTDFTVIAKRISQASTNDTMFITKGQDGVVANSALGLEYRNINGEYVYSFGTSTNVESIPDLITYCTPTNYNGKVLTRGNVQDTNGIQIGKFDIKYWKGVFYKLMFYTKTIDQLSINMLKNLFERDELIDVTNPIFKKQ